MRTKEEILNWIGEQEWRNEFYENAFAGVCRVHFDERFISGAFLFSDTPQGADVWWKRNDSYREWYAARPKSWEEFCERPVADEESYFITGSSKVEHFGPAGCRALEDANVMSKGRCEAFIAYMKLLHLRDAWVEGSEKRLSVRVMNDSGRVEVRYQGKESGGLTFPTFAMAEEFMRVFCSLLEEAKEIL